MTIHKAHEERVFRKSLINNHTFDSLFVLEVIAHVLVLVVAKGASGLEFFDVFVLVVIPDVHDLVVANG